jgi:chromosome segregation ATPase
MSVCVRYVTDWWTLQHMLAELDLALAGSGAPVDKPVPEFVWASLHTRLDERERDLDAANARIAELESEKDEWVGLYQRTNARVAELEHTVEAARKMIDANVEAIDAANARAAELEARLAAVVVASARNWPSQNVMQEKVLEAARGKH